MTLEKSKEVLENAGFRVDEVEALKGSCKVKGLSIGEGKIRPTLYWDNVKELDEEELISLARRSMEMKPDLDISMVKDRDYILENCVSCIRHKTDDENAVKWEAYGDLEEYVRLNMGETHGNNMSTIISKDLLKSVGISTEELHAHARKNLKETVRIQSMAEVLCGLMNTSEDNLDIPEMDNLLYVASNETRVYGASVMLLESVLQDFCATHGMDSCYIIPSSLHEVILTSTKMPIAEVNAMIQDVNETQVSEWERLSDHVYTFVAA